MSASAHADRILQGCLLMCMQVSSMQGTVASTLRVKIVPLYVSESGQLGCCKGLFNIVSAFILILIVFILCSYCILL